jgi:alkaline phosphatase D
MKRISRRRFLEAGSQSAVALLLRRSKVPRLAGSTSFVESLWSGAITPDSARVNAKIDHDSTTVQLLVSPNPDLSNPISSGFHTADTAVNNRMVGIPISDLSEGTQYYYGIESGGVVDDTSHGKFKTPAAGAQSFTFAFASCADTGSAHTVFETIRSLNPLFFLHTGDMHYENIAGNDRQLFRDAYDTVLTSATQSALYREVPVAYMWDDHDYGSNNSDGMSASRLAARLTYQEYTPHYPLVMGIGDVPIYQAFTIGRIRFILTDLRSERTPNSAPDNTGKSMMGAVQKAWFKNELLAANGQYAAIIWMSSVPWIGSINAGADRWAGFSTERREVANFIKDNGINGVVMLSGDAHMIALDDGSNSDYADGGGAAFPVMHAAALDRSGSESGGPYSHGSFPGRGQFGLMTIADDGGDVVSFTLSGRDENNNVIVEYSFEHACCQDWRVSLPLVIGD